MNLIIGILLGALAQAITFIQLQGQFKWPWAKQHPHLMVLMGIPISYLFIASVRHMVVHFGGEIWPSRLIGFAIGTVMFVIMSHYVFAEPFKLKTLICVLLAVVIVCVQLFMD